MSFLCRCSWPIVTATRMFLTNSNIVQQSLYSRCLCLALSSTILFHSIYSMYIWIKEHQVQQRENSTTVATNSVPGTWKQVVTSCTTILSLYRGNYERPRFWFASLQSLSSQTKQINLMLPLFISFPFFGFFLNLFFCPQDGVGEPGGISCQRHGLLSVS